MRVRVHHLLGVAAVSCLAKVTDGGGRGGVDAHGARTRSKTTYSTPSTDTGASVREQVAEAARKELERAAKAADRADPFAAIDVAVEQAIADRNIPGAVVVIGRKDRVIFEKAYGARALVPSAEPMTLDTIFDLASITKPMATATSVLVLAEKGKLALDDPASKYIPELARTGANGRDAKGARSAKNPKLDITIRDLLLHVSGLPAETPLREYERGRGNALASIYRATRKAPRGAAFVYSDIGFLLLEEVVRRVSGAELDVFARDHVFAPLGMRETTFRPPAEWRARIAPTEVRDGEMIRAVVHDPRAFRLGGVAGHAGLFSTARDVTRFAQAMLRHGELDGVRVLSAESTRRFLAAADVPGGLRALGWDVRSAYSTSRGEGLSPRAVGHGGYTGTSLWIDPEQNLFVLFLSHRVHPEGRGSANPLAKRIGTLAALAVAPEEAPLSAGVVDVGIDTLRARGFAPLRGARVGLITNDAARSRDGKTTKETLAHAEGVTLVALFSPEHGAAADREGAIGDGRDDATGVPVYSLYGKTTRPVAATLEGIDTLVFDLQDTGARFYTYGSTMRRAMEVAAERGLRFVVLDRPNPIGGTTVDGPIATTLSFVNHHPLPVRHGMTMGELSLLFAADLSLPLSLEVVPLRGWSREAYFDETGLVWTAPSPNLRSVESVVLYPAVALVEGTNVSVGRGTDMPFEVVGAPWIDGDAFTRALGDEAAATRIGGVTFSKATFVPSTSLHAGKTCEGVRLRVTDRRAFEPVKTGFVLARTLQRLYRSRWTVAKMADIVANREVFEALRAGKPVFAIEALYARDVAAFRVRREKHLLYAEPSTTTEPAAGREVRPPNGPRP